MPELTAPEITVIVQHPQDVPSKRLVSIPRTAVFTCEIDTISTVDPASGAYHAIVFDSGTAIGTYADIEEGMTIDVGSAAGLNDLGTLRVRRSNLIPVSFDETNDIIRFQEIMSGEIALAPGVWFTVRDEFLIWPKMPRIEPIFVPGVSYPVLFLEWHDYQDFYLQQNDLIVPVCNVTRGQTSRLPVRFAGNLDAGQIYRTVTLSGFQSFPVATGATIVGYQWDEKDGTIVVGSDTSHSITVQFPEGFRYITLTIEDSNGEFSTRRIPIWAVGDTYPYITNFDITADERDAGRRMTFQLFGQPDDGDDSVISEQSLICYYETGVNFNGEDVPDQYIDQFLGWSTEENHILEKYSGTRSLEVLGPAGWLDLYDGFAQTITDNGTTDTWYYMTNITMDRIIHYILRSYTTALPLINLYFSGITNESPGEQIPKATIWNQIETLIASNMFCQAKVDSGCSLWLRRIYSYLETSERSSVDKIATLDPSFLSNDSPINYVRNKIKRVGATKGGGSTWSASTVAQFASLAPGLAASYAPGKEEAPFQRLPLVDPQDTLNNLMGHHFYRLNSPRQDISFPLIGNFDVFEPAWGEPFIYDSSIPTVSGLIINSVEYWIKSVSVSHSSELGSLSKSVTLNCEEVTIGLPGQTLEIPELEIPPDYTIPIVPTYPAPVVVPDNITTLLEGVEDITLFMITNDSTEDSSMFTTHDFPVASPTWTEVDLVALGLNGRLLDAQQDPFSPTSWWLLTTKEIRKINDVYGSPSLGSPFTFFVSGDSMPLSDTTPYGRYTGGIHTHITADGFVVVELYFTNSGSPSRDGHYVYRTTDGGVNWVGGKISSNVSFCIPYVSSHTGGIVFISDNTGGQLRILKSVDYAASFSSLSGISVGNFHLRGFHMPHEDNSDDGIFFFSVGTGGGSGDTIEYMWDHGTVTDVTPHLIQSGPSGFHFLGCDSYAGDRQIMIGNAIRKLTPGPSGWQGHAPTSLSSSDGGLTWTPNTDSGLNQSYQYRYAFSGDNPLVAFRWGSNGRMEVTVDGGANWNYKGGTTLPTSIIAPPSMDAFVLRIGG